ncbi:MAG: hypothetical protein IJ153_10790 [Clostridia bacterium]|nr:hypothetical protein [Clostridia bacterium]
MSIQKNSVWIYLGLEIAPLQKFNHRFNDKLVFSRYPMRVERQGTRRSKGVETDLRKEEAVYERTESDQMNRFVSREKMGKKSRRTLDSQQRRTWPIPPATKAFASKKVYNRKKKSHDDQNDWNRGIF